LLACDGTVSKAELALALTVFQVTGAAVAAEDPGEYFARERDLVKDEVRRKRSPEPAFFSAGPVSSFVAVDDVLVGQLLFQFRSGLGHLNC
jgi:hypothetical protein